MVLKGHIVGYVIEKTHKRALKYARLRMGNNLTINHVRLASNQAMSNTFKQEGFKKYVVFGYARKR